MPPHAQIREEVALPSHDALIDAAFSIGMLQARREIEVLRAIVTMSRPRNILEIGIYKGGTFSIWANIATGKKIAVDLPERAALQSFIGSLGGTFIIGRSQSTSVIRDVGRILDGEGLDFCFIDGDHKYEEVKRDYLVYREFMNPGGIMAFHDVHKSMHHESRNSFVGKLWEEIKGDKLTLWSGRKWGGIGVLFV